MATQLQRRARLENDYREMMNINGGVASVRPREGTPPHIESYDVTVHVRTITGRGPRYANATELLVTLPNEYPDAAPLVQAVRRPFPFHPNWFSQGRWCHGGWSISEGLGHFVVRMIRTLQYDQEITNERSPANSDANEWYQANRLSGIFPCDRTMLPDPTQSRFRVETGDGPATGMKTFRPHR